MGGLGSPGSPHGGSGVVQFTSLAQLDVAYGRRVTKEVNGRMVTVLAHGGQLFALDAACFHLGGPLGAEGDIEELAGNRTCIVCPWHRRKIDLRTGQQVDTDLQGALCPSHDAKQRVYPTRVDADGSVWVDCLSADGPGVQSGIYSSCLPQAGGLGGGGRHGSGLAQQLGLACGKPAAPPQTPAVWGERRATASPPAGGSVLPQLNQGLMPFRAQKASARNANARMAVLRKLAAVKEAECAAMES